MVCVYDGEHGWSERSHTVHYYYGHLPFYNPSSCCYCCRVRARTGHTAKRFSVAGLFKILWKVDGIDERETGIRKRLIPPLQQALIAEMADSWEDEDVDEVSVPVVSSGPSNWDDEEDETLIEQAAAAAAAAAAAQPTPAQIEAAKRKAKLEEEKLENQLKFALQADETAEQRKIRERKQVEDADAAIAEDLFDGVDSPGVPKRATSSTSAGIGGIALKNKEDHVNFGITVSNKLSGSTSFCIQAFLKEVINRNGDTLSAESLTDIAAVVSKLQANKKQAADLAQKAKPKSKKEQKAKAKKFTDTFGGDYDKPDEYESYASIEDDYMF